MIRRIQATNFRRYEEFELLFDDDAQLILIDGANGAGKTTILEAIHFALWGEGRSGRRNLDQLVRRGADLEGMQVELTLQVGEDTYTVNRRRDGRSSTAVLYCNAEPLVEGPNEVSEEVGRILGMDAAGFRLAVTAQQGDLEGLVSLRAAERNRMVSRLLRLDAIAAARAAANDTSRQQRSIAQSLHTAADPAEVDGRRSRTASELEAARRAEREASAAAAAALEAAAELEPAAREHQRRSVEREKSNAVIRTLAAQKQEMLRRIDEIETALSNAEASTHRSVADVERDLGEARVAHARAEASAERSRHRRSLEKDVADLESALAEIADIETQVGPEPRPEATSEQLAAAEAAEKEAHGLYTVALKDLERLEEETDLGDVCPTCEQPVGEDHRQSHRSKREHARAEAKENLRKLKDALDARTSERARVAEMRAKHEKALTERRERQTAAQAAAGRRKDAETRLRIYRERIADLPSEAADPTAAAESVRALEQELAEARKQEKAAAERERHRSEQETLLRQLKSSEERISAETSAAEAYAADPALQEAAEKHESLLSDHATEKDLRTHWAQQVAMLEERLRGVESEREAARKQAEKQQEHQSIANAAAGAARILSEAASTLSSTIRPELEAALTRLLAQMSEGRFPRAAIGDDYEVTVEDDGQLRSIDELSGGEKDLVALALRLALSQTFTTHSGEGAGFLILDECFGSQDPDRRRAILTALRELRSEYRQLFIISHVEGLEDAADSVLHVERPEDGPSTVEDRR